MTWLSIPQALSNNKDVAGVRLKAALQEHQCTASRQYFQIVELEATLAQVNNEKAIEAEARR